MRIEIRVTEAFLRRLDAFAQTRGMNRSAALRAAVLEASPAAPGELPPGADRDELLRLLGEAARGGSVPAIRALLDERRGATLTRTGPATPASSAGLMSWRGVVRPATLLMPRPGTRHEQRGAGRAASAGPRRVTRANRIHPRRLRR